MNLEETRMRYFGYAPYVRRRYLAGEVVVVATTSAFGAIVVGLVASFGLLFGGSVDSVFSYYLGGAAGAAITSVITALINRVEPTYHTEMDRYLKDVLHKGEEGVRADTRRILWYALRANFLTWPLGVLWFLFRKFVLDTLRRPTRAA